MSAADSQELSAQTLEFSPAILRIQKEPPSPLPRMVLYVLLGCVMDELSMLLLTIPVIFPAVMALPLLGLANEPKAIWFGILVLMTVGIGMTAPPVGLNVYVVNGLARDVPMSETYRGVMPFLAWDLLRMVLLLLFPGLSLWLVSVLYK